MSAVDVKPYEDSASSRNPTIDQAMESADALHVETLATTDADADTSSSTHEFGAPLAAMTSAGILLDTTSVARRRGRTRIRAQRISATPVRYRFGMKIWCQTRSSSSWIPRRCDGHSSARRRWLVAAVGREPGRNGSRRRRYAIALA